MHEECPECSGILLTASDFGSITDSKVWTGEEVYGRKKVLSDEHRADLEESIRRSAEPIYDIDSRGIMQRLDR